jgi:hypothetical protein
MIVCNLFDVSLDMSGDEFPIVIFVIRTDLPSGTQIISTCRRSYRDAQGTDSLWFGQSDRMVVSADGECRGRIDINASDKKASEHFRQLNTGYSSSGISSPVSDTVE